MTETFIIVEANNEPGMLGKITSVLGNGNTNIQAFAADSSGVRFLVDDTEKAVNLLNEAGFTTTTADVLGLQIPDQPGALAEVTTALGDAGVNIVTTFGAVNQGTGTVFIRPDDLAAAEKAVAGTTVTTAV